MKKLQLTPTGKSVSVSFRVRAVRVVRAGEAKLRGRVRQVGPPNAGGANGNISFFSGGVWNFTDECLKGFKQNLAPALECLKGFKKNVSQISFLDVTSQGF